MKKIYEVWIPRKNGEEGFTVRFLNGGKKYEWSSFNHVLRNMNDHTSLTRRKNFSNVFNNSEQKWIKSTFNVNKKYANALKRRINSENNTKKNFRVVHRNKNVTLYYVPNKTNRTYVNTMITNPFEFNISSGHTHPSWRGKGIGKQMRALMTLAAKNAGFKKVTQTAVFVNNRQRATHKKPPSSYVMKSLGFNVGSSYNNLIHHRYNFNKKPNNTRLIRAAFPLRTHPLSRNFKNRLA